MPRIANPVSPVRLRTAPPYLSHVLLPVDRYADILGHNRAISPSGEIGRHIGLKIRRFVNNGHTSSSLVSGTTAKKSEKYAIFHFENTEQRNFCAFRYRAKTQKLVYSDYQEHL